MGYSCTASASLVFSAITKLVGAPSSNALPDDLGFYERGREREDGAIVGTVFKTIKRLTPEERAAEGLKRGINPDWIGDPCRRAGSFKISARGKIERFPLLSKAIKMAAEAEGAKRYQELYG